MMAAIYCGFSFRVLVLLKLAHCHDLVRHLNRMETLVVLLVTPVLFLVNTPAMNNKQPLRRNSPRSCLILSRLFNADRKVRQMSVKLSSYTAKVSENTCVGVLWTKGVEQVNAAMATEFLLFG